MNSESNWIDDVIVLNENGDPSVAGDVQIFRNEGEVERQLEDWYVNEVDHLALTGTGRKATLGLRNRMVVVERLEPFAEGPTLLYLWLRASAQHLLSVRTERAHKGKGHLGSLEAEGVLPDTVEGLIAYIGFTK
jgi:hypothetical protein